MIGIIGAMDEEVILLKSYINDLKETTHHSLKFYEGKINEKKIVLMQSGIGKVNAALATTILLEKYPIDFVLNIGTAGGLKDDCEVLDIVLSEKVGYHDVDVTGFDYHYGQIPHLPQFYESDKQLLRQAEMILYNNKLSYHKGLIVTGDQFVHEENARKKVIDHFPQAIALEMEAAAIAQICFIYKVPFLVVRSLSDIAGKSSNISFDSYLERSAKNSSMLVMELIQNLYE